ncbi:hypothetical protein CCACVL1_03568 [Corchorus capsularis]|uniref:Uncharacterized protein n=1 Tax=Corchorus capsularis TaxID=210143 RepID=A0A1R3JYH4_COCAP|nr:hypothetical protein CCACVL1_03568 [Corchorus capsularis]
MFRDLVRSYQIEDRREFVDPGFCRRTPSSNHWSTSASTSTAVNGTSGGFRLFYQTALGLTILIEYRPTEGSPVESPENVGGFLCDWKAWCGSLLDSSQPKFPRSGIGFLYKMSPKA